MWFKKKKQLYSPANGTFLAIEEIPDEVFAKKLLGTGFGVSDHDGLIFAPCAGKVVNIFPTKHAITIETKKGDQVLVHIGLDTVELKGGPFEVLCTVGENVSCGQKIAVIDQAAVKKAGKQDVIIVVTPDNQVGTNANQTAQLNSGELAFEF